MAIDIDEAKVNRNEFGLWLAWTFATALGMIVGYLPAALVVGEIDYGIARVVVPLLAGLVLGVAQWLVLRGYVTASYNWIINHAAGWVVGYAIGLLVVSLLSAIPFGALVGFLLFGVIVALFQWPIFRREMPQIWPWILANVIGWTLGAFISQWVTGAVFQNMSPSLLGSTLLTVGITGLVAGAITAFALIWIVRKPEISV